MTTPQVSVGERLAGMFGVRREVSQTPDLVALLLGHLTYRWPPRPTPACQQGLKRLRDGPLSGVRGARAKEFATWLNTYLTINSTSRGVSYYPFHPSLTLSGNGEGPRVDGFLAALAEVFTTSERDRLVAAVWNADAMPAFERAVHDVVQWQMGDEVLAPGAPVDQFAAGNVVEADAAAAGGAGSAAARRVLRTAKEDLLYLTEAVSGTRMFVEHAGRLLAFSMTRYLLVLAGVSLDVPLFAAPAADTHPAVKTLAHEVLTIHRSRFREALRALFNEQLAAALQEQGFPADPGDEATARAASHQVLGGRANVVPPGSYAQLRDEHGRFDAVAYHYYWTHSGAGGRFLRQLHTAQLNLAKKAGLALARSQHSQWHFYWLSPAFVETLVLAGGRRLPARQVLLADLIDDWQARYALSVLVDPSWDAVYRRHFRGLGSPEALNEPNRRRLGEILAEQGRLRKNSDDFPWVVVRS
jgi:hypothetical protein